MMGSLAILGMPPFGVFASEFLILTTAMREQPWATPILLLALGVAFAAIFSRVQPMVFGETTAKRLPHPPALLPVFAHLGTGADARASYIPPYLADWYRAAARLIGGSEMPLRDWFEQRCPTARCARRCTARAYAVERLASRAWRSDVAAAGGGRLISLWASRRHRRRAPRARRVRRRRGRAAYRRCDWLDRNRRYPGLEQLVSRSASRMQRAVADLSGLHSTDADQRPWLRHAAWPAAFHPLSDAGIADQPSAACHR